MELNLTANSAEQTVIKEYLEKNASDILAEKINYGVTVEKDGKTLINKKTLDGFMRFAISEARKLAQKGAGCACVQDSVVFGWAIHYFEEESITEELYEQDGSKYTPSKLQPKTTTKIQAKAETKPTVGQTTKDPAGQMSMFDFITEDSETLKIDTSTGEVVDEEAKNIPSAVETPNAEGVENKQTSEQLTDKEEYANTLEVIKAFDREAFVIISDMFKNNMKWG